MRRLGAQALVFASDGDERFRQLIGTRHHAIDPEPQRWLAVSASVGSMPTTTAARKQPSQKYARRVVVVIEGVKRFNETRDRRSQRPAQCDPPTDQTCASYIRNAPSSRRRPR